MTQPVVVSQMDVDHLAIIRARVRDVMRQAASTHAAAAPRVLDVAPQVHEGARAAFQDASVFHTFDIDPASGCTYIGDLCTHNPAIADGSYDVVVCTEVLEHVLQPFAAIAELERILAPGGILVASSPFNFRIHGPLPDCWRFTVHGWHALLRDWTILELVETPTPDRDLMPIHYTVIARRRAATSRA